MADYEEARQVKQILATVIDRQISENETVKSCIKARRAVVTTAANTTVANRVGVKLIGDNTELFLPYNPVFAPDELVKGMIVSVWYNYSLNNGIVMQDAKWQQSGGAGGGGQAFDPTGTYPDLTSGDAINVTSQIGGKLLSSIFENDGTTVKQATNASTADSANDPNAVHFTAQTLNTTQKSQARTNIGAAGQDSLEVEVEARTEADKTLQTAIDGKQSIITGAASSITDVNLAGGRVLISNPAGKVDVSSITYDEIEYLDGLSSNVQQQINDIVDGNTAVQNAKHADNSYDALNVSSSINGHLITDIFETDGTTVKNATNAEVANRTGSIVIQNNADLNDCIANINEVQVYTCQTHGTAATLANCPVAVTFTLWATRAFYSNDTNTRDIQFLIATNSQCYYRVRSGGTNWANWRTLVESNGSYPTLGAGYLPTWAVRAGGGAAQVGWHLIGEISNYTGTTNRSYSCILLVNGIYPQSGGAIEESGILQIRARLDNNNFRLPEIYVLSGNLELNNYCLVVDSTSVKIYAYLSYQYAAIAFTLLSEMIENIKAFGTLSLVDEYYGPTAPSGAVYAVNRNRARPTFIATKTAKVTNTPTIGRDIILNGADFVPENVTKGDNCVVYAYSEDTSWLCTGYVSITPPNPAIVITGVEEINNATPYLDKSTYQNDITGNKVFSSIGLSQNGRFRTWDGGSSNDSFPNNGGYEIASNGIWYYPGASISESYQIHWVDGANGKQKLAIDTDGLAADDNSNAVATTEWVTDKINDELSGIGATVDLTSDVTGILPVENGGTGASSLDAANIVTKNTTQVISGGKSFSTIPQISAVINTSDNSTHVPTTEWVKRILQAQYVVKAVNNISSSWQSAYQANPFTARKGYVRIAYNNAADLLICFGIFRTSGTITFPRSYSFAPFVLVAPGSKSDMLTSRGVPTNVTTTNFTTNSSGTYPQMWLSIGLCPAS